MAHFYGTVEGNAQTEASRRGSESSGLTTIAASWNGAIRVRLWHENGKDCFQVSEIKWKGNGRERAIATGVLGNGEVA